MRTRVLPRNEWHRLSESGLPKLLALAPDAEVHVVEDGSEIVGCLAAVRVTLLEGAWVSEKHRGKTGVARHLRRLQEAIVGRWGFTYSTVTSDCMRRIMGRLGAVKSPDMYVLARET